MAVSRQLHHIGGKAVAAAPDRCDRRRFRRISLDLAAQPADLVVDGVVTQPDQKGAVEVWRHVADQLRPRWPKLITLMDESETDVLAYMAFPAQKRTKLYSTNLLERLNKKVKRRAYAVGIFPNEESILRLIGAVQFEQNDDWQSQHRYMIVEAFGQIDTAQIDPLVSITTRVV